MFKLEVFAEEMLTSQANGALSDYCLKHWDEALEHFPNGHNDMGELADMASGVNVIGKIKNFGITTSPSFKYWQFVESLKSGQS